MNTAREGCRLTEPNFLLGANPATAGQFLRKIRLSAQRMCLGWVYFMNVMPLVREPHALPTGSRTMSGSSRSGFTWKEVADVLRVSQISDSASLRREIKSQRKEMIGAKRTRVDTNDGQRTSEQAQLRRPVASR
jgi:hypothetical protein